MSKIKNIMKGGVLAVFLAVFSIAPAFATCDWNDSELNKHNLSSSESTSYPVKCPSAGGKTVYGATSADCAKWGSLSSDPDCGEGDLNSTIQTIVNMIIFLIGIVAVIMMIIGGVQYSLSQGDAAKVKKAKDTILYGVIGLVIAILAFAIVNFVLDAILS